MKEKTLISIVAQFYLTTACKSQLGKNRTTSKNKGLKIYLYINAPGNAALKLQRLLVSEVQNLETQRLPLSPQEQHRIRNYTLFCVETAVVPPFSKLGIPELISLSVRKGNSSHSLGFHRI